jgi:hypothetical protein
MGLYGEPIQPILTEDAGYEMAGILLFPTVGIDRSFFRPANGRNSRTMRSKSQKISVSVLRSGKRLLHPAFANLSRYGASPVMGTDAPDLTVVMVGRP